jgi:hypothetical protein
VPMIDIAPNLVDLIVFPPHGIAKGGIDRHG